MSPPRNVVVVGLMGSGKSTIGRLLATRLGRRYIDNDEQLERDVGRSAHELAASDGLDALHREEAASLVRVLDRTDDAVVGAGASTIEDPDIRSRLRNEFVVWLDTPLDTLVARFDDRGHRPVIDGTPRQVLERQYEARAPLFRAVASTTVSAHDETPDRAVDEILAALASTDAGTR
jgi:shikimate kinase